MNSYPRDEQSTLNRILRCFAVNKNVVTAAQIQAVANFDGCRMLDQLRQEGHIRLVGRCPARYELLSEPRSSERATKAKNTATKAKAKKQPLKVKPDKSLSPLEQHLKQWGVGA